MVLPPDDDRRDDPDVRPENAVDATADFDPPRSSVANEFGETQIGQGDTGGGDSQQAAEPRPESFGKYEVRDELGRGGFGTVYLGYDPQLDRKTAIKVPLIQQHSAQGRMVQDQFLEEARKLAQLNHPGIVTVLDVGMERDQIYIVSEYLDGKNLNRWMHGRTVSWPEAISIIAQLADALAYAHSQSTVHRDLKPANIILTERAEGLRPVIVDFGLAVSDTGGIAATRGSIAGTPNYMSPEQALGEGHRIDGRTDIYALGVILYRMICGQLPFAGFDVSALLQRVVREEPKPPRQLIHDIPLQLEAVCLKAMAKDIADRYTTAGDMARELREILRDHEARQVPPPAGGTPDEAKPVGPVRRQVTVLHCECDLFESTEFFENLDPEQQHEILQDYEKMCREVVGRLDGRIVQSTGEVLLVCFGYPTAYEDAARRAVGVGLDLLQRVSELQDRLAQQYEIEFSTSIGVHTGLAVLQEGEDGESFSMTGDARSVATRLDSVSQQNAVVITESTYRIVQGFFECESQGTFKIKGARKPLEVFLIKGESEARSRIDVAEMAALTPMVGRDTELAVLLDLWEQAADGSGQIVCLIGEAGLGKSRLVRELREHVLAEQGQDQHPVLEWRCSPFFRNTGFYPAIDYFERLLDFKRESSPIKRLDKLAQHLEQSGLGEPESLSLLADLLSVAMDDRCPPLELSPIRQRELTQQTLLRYIRQSASRDPILFIIEDLHWVDASTLEWLGQLVDLGPNDQLLTLLTFRPEFETPWGSRGHQTHVALNRLSRQQIAEMVRERMGVDEVPAPIQEKIVDRTEGVPLFIEEFCRLIRESALQELDGTVGLAADFELDSIPSTLQDLLVSRLDRLESKHDIARIGATIGREFSHEMISAVSGLPDATLEQELAQLAAAEVLFREGTPPQAFYTFKHALIQDAAYESLLRKTKQEYHHRTAEVLETQFPESIDSEPELLAHHFTEAGESQQGIAYWLKAGRRAQARWANAEAIEHFQSGLKLIATLDESPQRDQMELDFQIPLSTVMTMARGWAAPEVEPVHLRARELCERIGEGAPQFHVTWGMWAWRLLRDELDTTDQLAKDVWELAEAQQDPGYLMEAHFARTCTALFRGDLADCLSHGERGIKLYDTERCRFHAALTGQNCGCTIQAHWGWGCWIAGYPDQALSIGQRGVDLGGELNDPFSHAFALYHLGCVQQHCRMGRQAIKSGEKSIAIGKEQGFGIWIALGTLCLGSGLVLEGKQIEQGVTLVKEGFESFRASGAELSLTHYFAVLAEAYQAAGRVDEALEAVQGGLELAERSNERFHEANLYRIRGDLFLAQSAVSEDKAEECYQQAIQVSRQQAAKSWELRAAMSLARLWRNDNRQQEARELLAGVYDWFTEGFQTPDLLEARSILQE